MAPHSSTLVWKIPWTEEPGRLQSMRSLRVGHDWVTSLSRAGEGNGNPLQCSCLENPKDGGTWWAAVYGVAQSRTRLKWLSSRAAPESWEYMFLHHETIIRVKWAKLWMLLSTGSLSTYLQVRIVLLQLDFGLQLLEGSSPKFLTQ